MAADLQSGDETMVHRITIVAVIAAIAVGCLYLSWLGTVSPPPPWPAPASAGESQKAKAQSFVGTDSCSGRSCHGGIEQEENKLVAQDEYTKWLLQDPHAGAYEALFNSRSKRIAKNLNIARKPKIRKPEMVTRLAVLPSLSLVENVLWFYIVVYNVVVCGTFKREKHLLQDHLAKLVKVRATVIVHLN